MAALASSWTASASASGSAASHECSSSLGIAAGHGGCISSHVSLAARLRLPLLSIDAVQGRPSCSGGRRARLQQVAAMENHVAADSFAAEQSPPADFAADVSTWDELGPSDVNLEESNSVQIPRERQRIFDSIAPVYDQKELNGGRCVPCGSSMTSSVWASTAFGSEWQPIGAGVSPTAKTEEDEFLS